jgi:asparagine synthase (glutamine-hydrolysing)
MQHHQYIHRVVNLLDPTANVLLNVDYDTAESYVRSGDAKQVEKIDGQFAILAQVDKKVRMARSIGRPMRYFLAKRAEGPALFVAESMHELKDALANEGLADQFHPSYTRMIPAHHLVELELLGCPDPNPHYHRFFTPERNTLPNDLDLIGRAYIGGLTRAIDHWLDTIPRSEPLGVLFSGGIDSGAVLITLNDVLLKRGESPARLKAFTLRVDHNAADADQALQFVEQTNLAALLEIIDVDLSDLDWRETVRTIEDYKPLDVQSGTMAMALCQKIRHLYPDWKYLIDGDGGDENLKDYPIEENPELTIRSVLSNLMLYQEGWGVHAIKHSLTHSGGQSRGHIRTSAPARKFGFEGFSPFSIPSVIEAAEGIPFIQLTDWDHEKLYALKGEVVRRGVQQMTGVEMPIFEKRRFQHGAISKTRFAEVFPTEELDYRTEFLASW